MKHLILSFFLGLTFVNAYANPQGSQENEGDDSEARGFNISVSPIGSASLFVSNDDHINEYPIKSLFSAEISKEIALGNLSTILLLNYSHGELDECDIELPSEKLIPDMSETNPYYSIQFAYLGGNVLNKYGRIKFPFYIGPTFSYENCGPIHNLTFDLQAVARMKCYVTRKWALFIGARGRYGWGSKSSKKYGQDDKKALGMSVMQFGLEAGLSISLN